MNRQPRFHEAACIVFAGVVTIVVAGLMADRGFAQSQSAALPTVDQVLDKFTDAVGGRAALEKHSSRVSKGMVEVLDVGLIGSVLVSEKAPDKVLTIVEMLGMVMREGADASGAWEDDLQNGVTDKTGLELADARRGATFNAELKMKSLYQTIVVTGQEQVGLRPAYVILATPVEGTPIRMYFDAETGLIVRKAQTRSTASGLIEIDLFLEDYRDVDGVKRPFTVRHVTPNLTTVIRFTEIKHDVPLDDAIFKRPGIVR